MNSLVTEVSTEIATVQVSSHHDNITRIIINTRHSLSEFGKVEIVFKGAGLAGINGPDIVVNASEIISNENQEAKAQSIALQKSISYLYLRDGIYANDDCSPPIKVRDYRSGVRLLKKTKPDVAFIEFIKKGKVSFSVRFDKGQRVTATNLKD